MYYWLQDKLKQIININNNDNNNNNNNNNNSHLNRSCTQRVCDKYKNSTYHYNY